MVVLGLGILTACQARFEVEILKGSLHVDIFIYIFDFTSNGRNLQKSLEGSIKICIIKGSPGQGY